MAYQGFSGNPVDPHFATKAIHVGQEPEQWKSLAVVPLISLSSTFKQAEAGREDGYVYSRSGNPTRDCLEKCIASLENGKYGLCTPSGLAATDLVNHMLHAGDHVICCDDVYGGTGRFFRTASSCLGIETTFASTADLTEVKNAIKKNTRLIWLETPTNPTMKISDISAIAQLAKSHENIILVVDNTFLTPVFQQPLNLGADIVMHSLTKYMNGHSDVVMGALVTNRDDLYEKLKYYQNAIGLVPSPFDCFLVNRGLKTLHLRMKEHMRNGFAVAKFLESHPCVTKVLFPGLPSHPSHELAKKQSSGCSGMVSFYIKGELKEAKSFLSHLKVFTLAESLGGFESLAELPAVMTHASVPREHRELLGLSDSLVRLSVGLEATQDLLDDIDQALKAAVHGNSNK